MARRVLTSGTLLGVLLSFGACVTEDGLGFKDETMDDGKADAWDYVNDPERFRVELNYNLGQLPQEGSAEQTPWPDDYWAYYRDSINYRWRGQDNPSPAELYDLAFNGWTMPAGYMDLQPQTGRVTDWDPEYYTQLGPLASEVHRRRGNYDATNGRDDDGDGEIDETDDYDGIETWWGICHAWAPAAVMEPEPQETVTYNGQTFVPSDIKGLMMIAYDSTRAVMLGGRCNAREVTRGDDGRVLEEECRDTNAGAFHVVITNMLGILRRSFVEDRTTNYEVWNQPLRSFDVTYLDDSLTAAQAMAVLGESGDTYTYNPEAVGFAEVRMTLRYITESSPSEYPRLDEIDRYTRSDYYHYILELDAHGDIIGGEWADESQLRHPDFLWMPTMHGTYFQHLSYENVRMLLDMSREGGGGGGGEGQVFETSPDLSIPDNDPTGVTSTLNVPATGTISGLQVNVNIEHTYIGDLTVTLRRHGEEVTLHQRQGGSADNLVQSFSVTNFDGQEVSGTWELLVSDGAGMDLGVLRSWGLNVILGGGGGGGGTGSTLTFSSTSSVDIPDDDESGAESVINVSDGATIRNLRVRVNIVHTWIGDLVVELRHAGQVRRLHNRSGGSDDNIEAEFQVQEFNNTDIQGEWALHVSDHAGYDVGSIVSWELIADVD